MKKNKFFPVLISVIIFAAFLCLSLVKTKTIYAGTCSYSDCRDGECNTGANGGQCCFYCSHGTMPCWNYVNGVPVYDPACPICYGGAWTGDCGGSGGITCNTDVNLNVAPNPGTINQSMNFRVTSGDASTWTGDSWSGGVGNCNGTWDNHNCTAQSAGSYAYTKIWRHCVNSVDNCSDQCTKSINFSVNAPVCTVTPPTLNIPTISGSDVTLSWSPGQNNQVTNLFASTSSATNADGTLQYLNAINGAVVTGTTSYTQVFSPGTYYWNVVADGCSPNQRKASSIGTFNISTTISGRVTNATTGAPIPGVNINSGVGNNPCGDLYHQPTMVTDNNGYYYAYNVPYGSTYCLRAPATISTSYILASGGAECQKAGGYFNTDACNVNPGQDQTSDVFNFTYTPIAALSATCTASPATVNVGGTVTYTANASGGVGPYNFSWSGTDIPSPITTFSDPSFPYQYSLSGLKDTYLTVTDSQRTTTPSITCPQVTVTSTVTPWLQAIGDVHSNTGINASGGP